MPIGRALNALLALVVIEARLLTPPKVTDATPYTVNITSTAIRLLAETRLNIAGLLPCALTRLTCSGAFAAGTDPTIIAVFFKGTGARLRASTIDAGTISIAIRVPKAWLFTQACLAHSIPDAAVIGLTNSRLYADPRCTITD